MMMYVLVYRLLDAAFQLMYFALLIRVLLSWIPHNPYHQLIQMLYRTTDPLLKPFQDIIPSWKIGIDLSPIFAFMALSILRKVLFGILF